MTEPQHKAEAGEQFSPAGGAGGAPIPPGGTPQGAPTGGTGAGGGNLTAGDDYTPADWQDGHKHAIVNINPETGNGVTEVQGDGYAVPMHAHAILGFFVRPYQRGAYISKHGSE